MTSISPRPKLLLIELAPPNLQNHMRGRRAYEAASAGGVTLCAGNAKIGSSSGNAIAIVLIFDRGTSTSSVLPG